jgi:hypothetical protein
MKIIGWGDWTHWLVATIFCVLALSFCAPENSRQSEQVEQKEIGK